MLRCLVLNGIGGCIELTVELNCLVLCIVLYWIALYCVVLSCLGLSCTVCMYACSRVALKRGRKPWAVKPYETPICRIHPETCQALQEMTKPKRIEITDGFWLGT